MLVAGRLPLWSPHVESDTRIHTPYRKGPEQVGSGRLSIMSLSASLTGQAYLQ